MEKRADWRSYLRAAARSPAASRLAPLYHAIGDIEAALCNRWTPQLFNSTRATVTSPSLFR